MKISLLFLLFYLSTISVFGQFPNNQTNGSPSTRVRSFGSYAADSGYIHITSFVDTASMNRGPYLKGIPGITLRSGDSLWMRSYDAKRWINITRGGSAGGGTVTSVGLSMPSAFTVTNSPVTGSGTLTVTGAGTTAQYIRGDGSLVSFPSLNFWSLTGDSGTVEGTNFLGTTDAQGLVFKTNNLERGRFTSSGGFNVGAYTGGSVFSTTFTSQNVWKVDSTRQYVLRSFRSSDSSMQLITTSPFIVGNTKRLTMQSQDSAYKSWAILDHDHITLETYTRPNAEYLQSGMYLDENGWEYTKYDGSAGNVALNRFHVNGDSSRTPKRISYESNINGSLQANSLITKRYVDSLTGGSPITASNGLTKVGNDIQLGGTATGNITVNMAGFKATVDNVDTLFVNGHIKLPPDKGIGWFNDGTHSTNIIGDTLQLIAESDVVNIRTVTGDGFIALNTTNGIGFTVAGSGVAWAPQFLGAGISPIYRLHVYDSIPDLSVDGRSTFFNTRSGYITTGGTLTNYTGYFHNQGFRQTGANDLVNVGLYSTASGAQQNYGAMLDQRLRLTNLGTNITSADTSTWKPLVQNTSTGDVRRSEYWYGGSGGGSGTVTSFSFTDGNGFDGTVTDATTTPTLSLTTTVTDDQVIVSNSGAISGSSALTFSGTQLIVTPSSNNNNTIRVNATSGNAAVQIGTYTGFPAYGGLWSGNIVPSGSNYAFLGDGSTETIFNGPTIKFRIAHGSTPNAMSIDASARVGIGVNSPTSKLHLPAGSATANTAPLQWTSGTLETVPRAGVMEFLTDKWYATITTGAARKELTLNDAALTSGVTPVATTNGRLTDGVILGNGSYTPTITNGTNVDASTPLEITWSRNGSTVHYGGSIQIDATATGSATVEISLPPGISSNFTSTTDAPGGAGQVDDVTVNARGIIVAEVTNNRLQLVVNATGTSTLTYTFWGTFKIL